MAKIKLIKLTIDDKLVEAEEGLTLIEVIDEVDMQLYGKRTIPRLCYHESLKPAAACKLCVVEVDKKGKSKIRTSCSQKISDGIKVKTVTNDVKVYRQEKLEGLFERAPDSEVLKDLAFKMGLEKITGYESKTCGLDNCIGCGLCSRICKDVIGQEALKMVGKGDERYAKKNDKDDTCIGCGVCSYVCPTSAIKMEEKDGKRKIWDKEFKLKREGKYKLTPEQHKLIKSYKGDAESPFKIEVVESLCKNCEMCLTECPQKLFSVDEKFHKSGYRPAVWKKDKLKGQKDHLPCAGCKACYDICPESAIDIYVEKKKVRIIK